MTCSNCGSPLPAGTTFCGVCGTRVGQTTSGAATVAHRLLGTTMPVLEITLQPGQSLVAEAGELSWMTSSIGLHTSTQKGGGQGMLGLFKRAVGGGTLFMTEYTATGREGAVAFATKMPGQILPVAVAPGQTYLVHRHGFVCATPAIELSMGFQRSLGAGIFGGAGLVLQKLAGTAQALPHVLLRSGATDVFGVKSLCLSSDIVGRAISTTGGVVTLRLGFTASVGLRRATRLSRAASSPLRMPARQPQPTSSP